MNKIKKNTTLTLLVLMVCGLNSCSDKVDPIWGVQQVDTTFAKGFPLSEFHALGIAGDTTAQKALVAQHGRGLTRNVITHYPCVKEENIHFILGSGVAEDVLSGDGNSYTGKFKNELLIVIQDSCMTDTLFLACGNGLLGSIRWKGNPSDLGTGIQCRFIIKKGEGIAHYKPALDEWASIAGDFEIPIKNSRGKIVPQEIYLNYLNPKYQGILFEGDVIDLCAGKVYNKLGQEVEFQRRLDETQKANSAIKTSEAQKKRNQGKKK
jgi:hypothetical protein